MTFFFMLNPKPFVDPSGLVEKAFGDALRKKRRSSIVDEKVDLPEEVFEAKEKLDDLLLDYSAIEDYLALLQEQLASKIEAQAREALELKRQEEYRRKIEIGRQVLMAEEEVMMLLIMMDS